MRKALPKEFMEINNAAVLYYILHGLGIWLGFGYLTYVLWVDAALPMYAEVPLAIICEVLAGLGLFCMAVMGHEGFHGSLNRNRKVSMTIGILASSLVPTFVSIGYNVVHWKHHKFTNTTEDPDYVIYTGHKTFFARAFKGPREVLTNCFLNAVQLLLKPELSGKTFPFSSSMVRGFSFLNIAAVALVTIVYGLIALTNIKLFLCLIVFPTIVTTTYWSMAPYMEHAAIDSESGYDTRTCTSFFLRWILLGYNYHICHHWFPRVQLHKLAAAHRYLVSVGAINEKAPVVDSVSGLLRMGATAVFEIPARDDKRSIST